MTDLSDLKPLSQKLNAASDELNQALQSIQDRLNELGLGVETWLESPTLTKSDWCDLADDREDPTGEREYTAQELGYGRLGEGWALLVRTRRFVHGGRDDWGEPTVREYEDNLHDRKPLLRSARALRIEAVKLIPALIEELKRKSTEAVAQVEQAKKIAESLK